MVAECERIFCRRRRARPDAAREGFPLDENGFDVGENEVGQPHRDISYMHFVYRCNRARASQKAYSRQYNI